MENLKETVQKPIQDKHTELKDYLKTVIKSSTDSEIETNNRVDRIIENYFKDDDE